MYMNHISGYLKVCSIIAGLLVSFSVEAGEVSIRKVYLPPEGGSENPQTFMQASINGEKYSCAWMGEDWSMLTSTYGYDIVVTPPTGLSGFMGVRVESIVDEKKNPIMSFTKELFDAELKQIRPDAKLNEGETLPSFQDGMATFDLDFRQLDGERSTQYHYSVRLIEGKKWTFICQASVHQYPELYQKFHYFAGTFSKVAEVVQASTQVP
jgi:hypothetical protein